MTLLDYLYPEVNKEPRMPRLTPSPVKLDFSNVQNGEVGVTESPRYGGNADEGMTYLTSKGLSPVAASGIMGNLVQESSLRSDLEGGEGSYGLAQWRLDRRDSLNSFAKAKGAYANNFYTQLDFLLKEAGERGDLDALQSTKDPTEAALIFGKRFERPSEQYARWDKRKSYAADIYKNYLKKLNG